jgi:hypothetical protein
LADRVRFAALARLIPRTRWTEIFPGTPATLLACRRRLATSKYDSCTCEMPFVTAPNRSLDQTDSPVAQGAFSFSDALTTSTRAVDPA